MRKKDGWETVDNESGSAFSLLKIYYYDLWKSFKTSIEIACTSPSILLGTSLLLTILIGIGGSLMTILRYNYVVNKREIAYEYANEMASN